MTLPRVPGAPASLLLRNHIRPAAPRTASAAAQLRRKVTAKDGHLGGPNGQQPPPPNPGGPEAVKRNWVPIGGAALAAVAAYAYFTSSKVTVDKVKQTDARNPSPSELEGVADAAKEAEQLGSKVGQQVAEQATKTMKEMSGRQKTEQGSFRHD